MAVFRVVFQEPRLARALVIIRALGATVYVFVLFHVVGWRNSRHLESDAFHTEPNAWALSVLISLVQFYRAFPTKRSRADAEAKERSRSPNILKCLLAKVAFCMP